MYIAKRIPDDPGTYSSRWREISWQKKTQADRLGRVDWKQKTLRKQLKSNYLLVRPTILPYLYCNEYVQNTAVQKYYLSFGAMNKKSTCRTICAKKGGAKPKKTRKRRTKRDRSPRFSKFAENLCWIWQEELKIARRAIRDFCFLKKIEWSSDFDNVYLAKNDHRWVT